MSDSPLVSWGLIRKSDKGDGLLEIPSRRTDVHTGYGYVYLALGPQGESRALVPCGPEALKSFNESSAALAVTHSSLRLAGRSMMFVDLMLLEEALAPVFGELVGEVLSRLLKFAVKPWRRSLHLVSSNRATHDR